MKKDILKIAGVKSEKEFYKKFPTEDAFMAKHGGAFHKAKRGDKLLKAQFGIPSEYDLNLAQYDKKTKMFNSPTGQISMYDTMNQGFTKGGSNMGALSSFDSANKALGGMGGIGGASTQLWVVYNFLWKKESKRKKPNNLLSLSEVAAEAGTSRDLGIRN